MEETNRYAAQENTSSTFSVVDLKTFSVVLVSIGYPLFLEHEFFEKKKMILHCLLCMNL